MPKVIVQTIVSEAMNAAAAANTGWQRAVSHSRIGSSRAAERTVCHGSGGSKTMMTIITTANAASATRPSTISLRGGGLRRASARPITSGATVMMPTASDANQCCQVIHIGADGLWNNLYAAIPPIPEAEVATTAAAPTHSAAW